MGALYRGFIASAVLSIPALAIVTHFLLGWNTPITAQGIQDAFQDAERCATAVHEAWSGSRAFDDAMDQYHRERDEHALPMYEFTCQLATLEPPPPDQQRLFAAIHGNREAMDAFVRMNAGTTSPADFFAPENVRAIMDSADARA